MESSAKRPKFWADEEAVPSRWFFELTTNYLAKLELRAGVDSRLVSSEDLKEHSQCDKLIPVILSHGLGGNRHAYSCIATQLASKGCFVITMDHFDEVKDILFNVHTKAPQFLEKRVQEVKKVGSGSIINLFGRKLDLDMSKLTVMGHSYGGVTSYMA
eukprot:CAMPEP_0176457974 /NCGR_PEP_ID=MMETSP0127-20121128/32295_1 /TAXON_ID=938130 /ORGANISM="Platyophrya macrostoma, Strain WH" /LENGTH=157 /DNA_ID=CAMNT_0017848411 /DNA_START=352 /DNA_END=821 /DNA_ORIENTATION=+